MCLFKLVLNANICQCQTHRIRNSNFDKCFFKTNKSQTITICIVQSLLYANAMTSNLMERSALEGSNMKVNKFVIIFVKHIACYLVMFSNNMKKKNYILFSDFKKHILSSLHPQGTYAVQREGNYKAKVIVTFFYKWFPL